MHKNQLPSKNSLCAATSHLPKSSKVITGDHVYRDALYLLCQAFSLTQEKGWDSLFVEHCKCLWVPVTSIQIHGASLFQPLQTKTANLVVFERYVKENWGSRVECCETLFCFISHMTMSLPFKCHQLKSTAAWIQKASLLALSKHSVSWDLEGLMNHTAGCWWERISVLQLIQPNISEFEMGRWCRG